MSNQRIACIFPGQGAQYPGMGKDFYENFPIAKETFQAADDFLKRNLSSLIFSGTAEELVATHNSQLAIYVVSIAIWRVIQSELGLVPEAVAGHSLGEYSALTASGKASFESVLGVVAKRGEFMSEACRAFPGKMAAIIGLEASQIEEMIQEISMPNDLWAANFNSPGQVVISGSLKGIEVGIAKAKEIGARRALLLPVHGAFHSGLMKQAEEKLKKDIEELTLIKTPVQLMMNVSADYVEKPSEICQNLIKQVTSPVRWEQGIKKMAQKGINVFVEVGCGKVLTGLGKRIGVSGWNVETLADLEQFGLIPV